MTLPELDITILELVGTGSCRTAAEVARRIYGKGTTRAGHVLRHLKSLEKYGYVKRIENSGYGKRAVIIWQVVA